MSYDDYETRWHREDADLANFRPLVVLAAHLALTNRALATALLALDTNPSRYADLCSFLDNTALSSVTEASALDLRKPDDQGEPQEPDEWTGDPAAVCSGRTLKGKPCTTRATFSCDGVPYCGRHYPFSPEYVEAERLNRQCWDEYWKQRRRVLDRYGELERDIHSLKEMNELLRAAVNKLGLVATVPDVSDKAGPMTVARVDGLNFLLEHEGTTPTDAWWLRYGDGDREALLQRWSENQWRALPVDPFTGGFRDAEYMGLRDDVIRFAHLYQAFYRMRQKRDLGWYFRAIQKLIAAGIEVSSGEPLRVLCGIEEPGSGWRVYQFGYRLAHDGWVREYAGASEAEARWHYAQTEDTDPPPPAVMLIDPAHQIIENTGGSTKLW